MKIAALDIGDQWTGTALSDVLKIIAKPYKTVETSSLVEHIAHMLQQEHIQEIIIGYPKTLKGAVSEQTKKVETIAEQLKQEFPQIIWRFWDERLSSKRAETQKKDHSKEEKLRSHSIAAAFILDSYLSYLKIHEPIDE